MNVLTREALRRVLGVALGILVCAAAGAVVRVLPWLLDPNLPVRVTLPFARSLLVLAAEASLVVGWPLGWALAGARFVERGEARVMATLGESPSRTAHRLSVQGAAFAAALAALALLGGRDANAPGMVVQDLLDEGRAACASAKSRETHVVPLVSATWLCSPGEPPRLVGKPPISAGGVTFSAARVDVSSDLSRFELTEARLATPPSDLTLSVHVKSLVLRGIPPFARASSLPPWLRALVLTLSAWASAFVTLRGLLVRGPRRRLTLHAVAIGVAGPCAALLALRQIETRSPALSAYVWVPVAALVSTLLFEALVSRLPRRAHTGSK